MVVAALTATLAAVGVAAASRDVRGALRRALVDPWRRGGASADAERALAAWASENETCPSGAVVFLGSSTAARGDWASLFPRARTLNRGLGGETTDALAIRLAKSFPPNRPAAAVFYLGAADLRMEGASAETALARADEALERFRRALDGVDGAVLEVLPARGESAERRAAAEAFNRGLAELAARRRLAFVRTRVPPIVDAQGELSAALAADDVHLNDAGYRALAERLKIDGGAAARALDP
ncbi:MAG TPA: GDSL-type esterase/lipase family protein [Planctomycetota bacterium]|nr:GDSL-type esterase/lipase family protein [Planctomycetota bacterium]